MIACYFYVAGKEHAIKHQEKFSVMSVTYRRIAPNFAAPRNFIESGHYNPAWTIHIFAVPVGHRHAINTLLLSDALPNVIKPWLMARQELTGTVGHHALSLDFEVANARLAPHERASNEPGRANL